MKEESSVLIVDDDLDNIFLLEQNLKLSCKNILIYHANSAAEAENKFAAFNPHVVILDLCLDYTGVESGYQLLKWFASLDITCRIIVLTGYAQTEHGIKALSYGAASFLNKPYESSHISAIVKDCIETSKLKRREVNAKIQDKEQIKDTLSAYSTQMVEVLGEIDMAINSTQPVLLTGETGTGKSFFANIIHQYSKFPKQNFVRYQPNFLSNDQSNSELFGYVRGSFTGAKEERKGLLHLADNGTFFIDEINELPIDTQVQLLGVLQDKKFRRIGSDAEIKVQFRLISAMNKDPGEEIRRRKLREDLYYRIAFQVIHIPSLRLRSGDISIIAQKILNSFAQRDKLSVYEIDSESQDLLEAYSWPGNIRELESVIERAALRSHLAKRGVIIKKDINFQKCLENFEPKTFKEKVLHYKKNIITETLDQCNGNFFKAARTLGVDRGTVKRLLESG